MPIAPGVHKRNSSDIHDRVNLAIQDSRVDVDPINRTITLSLEYDSRISQIMDYFEIYLYRMEMCKEAASHLGCRFRLLINNLELLGHVNSQLAATDEDEEPPATPPFRLEKSVNGPDPLPDPARFLYPFVEKNGGLTMGHIEIGIVPSVNPYHLKTQER